MAVGMVSIVLTVLAGMVGVVVVTRSSIEIMTIAVAAAASKLRCAAASKPP
jgi:hypothetical protein